jgi:hypothetical protein
MARALAPTTPILALPSAQIGEIAAAVVVVADVPAAAVTEIEIEIEIATVMMTTASAEEDAIAVAVPAAIDVPTGSRSLRRIPRSRSIQRSRPKWLGNFTRQTSPRRASPSSKTKMAAD